MSISIKFKHRFLWVTIGILSLLASLPIIWLAWYFLPSGRYPVVLLGLPALPHCWLAKLCFDRAAGHPERVSHDNKSDTLQSTESAQSEKEKSLFPGIYEGITMHIVIMNMLCEEQMQKLDDEQSLRFLAFELGVIEWHDQAIMRVAENQEGEADVRFFNFLIYYANRKYGELGESVFQTYKELATRGLMHEERRLGYESINDGINSDGSQRPGHIGTNHLSKAVGFSWP